MTSTTKQPLLTKLQKIGWGMYSAGSALAIHVAYATSGLLAAEGALSSALIGAAAALGINALRSNSGSGRA